MANFVLMDYVIFIMTVVVSLLIGIYHAIRARGGETTNNYLLAGGEMRALPVALSMLVTYESSIMVLGYPAEVYVHGFIFWFFNVGFFIGLIFVIRVSPKLFHCLQIKSVYEYLGLRFQENKIRRLAVALTIISTSVYNGVVLYGPAVALESITNIPQWATILGLGVIAIFYTSIGGLKAVIWIDVFQCIIIIAGIIAVLIKGTIESGGIQEVVKINHLSGRLAVDFNPNPMIRHTIWTLVIGESARVISSSFAQATVQRLKSTPNVSEARKVLYIATPGFLILQTLVMIEGLVAFAYFSTKGCDPLAAKKVSDPNQIIPFMVMDMFGDLPGVPGLFLATLCCASLSTVSSMLSAISAIVVEDVVKSFKKTISDSALPLIAKVSVPFTGCFAIGASFMIKNIEGTISQILTSIGGSFDSPLTAIFLLAVFVPFSTPMGVVLGGLVGILFSSWLSVGYSFSETRLKTPWLPLGPTNSCYLQNISSYTYAENTTTYLNVSSTMAPEVPQMPEGVNWLYSISYQYFGLMGVCFSFVMGLLFSLCNKHFLKRSQDPGPIAVDKKYMLSFSETFLCCFCKNSGNNAPDRLPVSEQDSDQAETIVLMG